MIVLIIVNLVAVLLAYMSSEKKNGQLFEGAFILLTFVYGIRYNYGNDFPAYENFFNYVTSFDSATAALGDGHFEDGWIFLNYMFGNIGFQWLVVFLTIMQLLPFYLLIKKHIDPKWRWLALFLFLFSIETLINLSMMRQCLAANIILLSLPLYEKKRGWLLGFVVILFAAQFHKTAYVMVIIPFLHLFTRLPKKLWLPVYFLVLLLAFIVASRVNIIIEILLGTDLFGQYESINTADERFLTYGIGFFLNLFLCGIILYTQHREKDTNSFLSLLYCMSYLFTVIAYSNGSVARLGAYFSSLFCVVVVFLIPKIKNIKIYNVILFLVLLIRLYAYWGFFFSPVWTRRYLHFTTIFNT